MRFRANIVRSLLGVASAILPAALSGKPARGILPRFQYFRVIAVRNLERPRPAAVRLDSAVFARCRTDFADIRIVDVGLAREIPRLIRRRPGLDETGMRPAHPGFGNVSRAASGNSSGTSEELAAPAGACTYALLGLAIREDARRRRTVLDFRSRREPLVAFDILTDSDNFSRPILVEALSPVAGRGAPRVLTRGRITRIHLGAVHVENIRVAVPETRAASYRILVENADNPPLSFRAVRAWGRIYQVCFVCRPGRRYRLYYGNPQARPPRYDAETVLGPALAGAENGPELLALGIPRENPAFRRSRTWWKSLVLGRGILWSALILVLGFLVWVLVQAVRQVELEEEVFGVPRKRPDSSACSGNAPSATTASPEGAGNPCEEKK